MTAGTNDSAIKVDTAFLRIVHNLIAAAKPVPQRLGRVVVSVVTFFVAIGVMFSFLPKNQAIRSQEEGIENNNVTRASNTTSSIEKEGR